MKFLCVACDEAMTLEGVHGPDEGSMTVVFGCPTCGQQVAMLTNAMETQVVRSLGVKIGGRTVPAEPMETLRHELVTERDVVLDAPEAAEPVAEGAPESASGSKCPFSGAVADAFERQQELRWTPDAEARIARIPAFARAMARQSIEQYARDQGYREIDTAVMEAVRGGLGFGG